MEEGEEGVIIGGSIDRSISACGGAQSVESAAQIDQAIASSINSQDWLGVPSRGTHAPVLGRHGGCCVTACLLLLPRLLLCKESRLATQPPAAATATAAADCLCVCLFFACVSLDVGRCVSECERDLDTCFGIVPSFRRRRRQ